jgi:hypothetical protein
MGFASLPERRLYASLRRPIYNTRMKPRLTRRELAASFAAASAAQALAQQPQTPGTPVPNIAPPPGTDLLAAERESLRRNHEALVKFDIPQATEPSFSFRP